LDALDRLAEINPDVITLDVEMPGLNGLDNLAEIMRRRPTPDDMVSSVTTAGTRAAVRDLSLGAVDVLGKPSGPRSPGLYRVRDELLTKLRAAAAARPQPAAAAPPPQRPAPPPDPMPVETAGLAVIGASTGGPGALGLLL